MRESQIERYLVKRVKQAGGEVRKVKWIGRRGAPDRFVVLPRWLSFWIELKAPGKKPTAQQQREHDRLRRAGQRVVVIDSIDKVDGLFH